jgi:hypothetical protein
MRYDNYDCSKEGGTIFTIGWAICSGRIRRFLEVAASTKGAMIRETNTGGKETSGLPHFLDDRENVRLIERKQKSDIRTCGISTGRMSKIFGLRLEGVRSLR